MLELEEKTAKIINACIEVHKELGNGFLEPIYQEALEHEFQNQEIPYEREKLLPIKYKGRVLSKQYYADFVCYDDIIVELKSVTRIVAKHRAQLCNYLRLTRKPVGLLINYGEECLIGERWVLDTNSNRCYLVDKDMVPINDADYHKLFYTDILDENSDGVCL